MKTKGLASTRALSAFVAMKFEKDAWNDPRYLAMSEVLEEAGFDVTRADQIGSSGEVVREVLDRLRTADLVVVDTTGESQSVSYELGYCHGIDRSVDTLVLLGRAGTKIPFNYSHFRHLLYRDLRHLRRLLRDRLDLTVPLAGDQIGKALVFEVAPGAGPFGDSVAQAVLTALRSGCFTGRCEYYAGDHLPGLYVVGVGLRQTRPRRPISVDWWSDFVRMVGQTLAKLSEHVRLDENRSEFGELGGIKNGLLPRGAAHFSKGRVVRVLGSSSDTDSWFAARANWQLGHGKRRGE